MDMTELGFTTGFDHILIPYNTLNLLRSRDAVHKCLSMCRSLLNPGGSLLLQVHCLDSKAFAKDSGKVFQFQMLPQKKDGEKIIKETLRSYKRDQEEIVLEERYRIRPQHGAGTKKDLCHILHLAAFTAEQWQEILQSHSFTELSLYCDYQQTPYSDGPSSLLLIRAETAV
jgi:hypothetical protein